MLVSLSYNYWSSTRRAVLSLPTRRSSDLQWRGVGGTRILKELDPISREILGFRLQFMRSLDRPIYVDNRPHPPALDRKSTRLNSSHLVISYAVCCLINKYFYIT